MKYTPPPFLLSRSLQLLCNTVRCKSIVVLQHNVKHQIRSCTLHSSAVRLNPNELVPVDGKSKAPAVLSPLAKFKKSIVVTSQSIVKSLQETVKALTQVEEQEDISRREIRKMKLAGPPPKPKEPFRLDRFMADMLFKMDVPSARWLEEQKKQKEEATVIKGSSPLSSSNPLDITPTLTSFMSSEIPLIDSLETRRGLYGTVLPPYRLKHTTQYISSLPFDDHKKQQPLGDLSDKTSKDKEALKDRFVTPSKLRLKNLPFGTTPEQIMRLFSPYELASIDRPVEMIHYPDGRFSGMAFVSFSRQSEAMRAKRSMNSLWFGQRTLQIDLVENNKDMPRIKRYRFHMINRARKAEPHSDF